MDKLLSVAELAQVLCTTPKAVYGRLKRGGQSVPAPRLSPVRHVCTGASPASRPGLRPCPRGPLGVSRATGPVRRRS